MMLHLNQPNTERESSVRRARIMVVEDDPNLLEGIRAILELDHYAVVTADNGATALGLLRSAATLPDLIVSDIMMPIMDGIEFLNEVRKEQSWVGVPFIFLTAKSDKSDMLRGKRLGVDDYLVKPFDADDLLVAIEARLKRQAAINHAYDASLSTVKKNILTILNHEFRTPLTFVVAYADMLNNQTAGDLSDTDMIQFLKGVGSGATRLRRLIENFILLVELETGDASRTFDWRRGVIDDVPRLLAQVWERIMQVQAPDRECEIDVEPEMTPFVGDREYLSIALGQLMSNALKFSTAETVIRTGARIRNNEVHLWVQDFGRGIPPAELDMIWEPFYQIDRSQYEDQGTGSGLAIVRGITRMHKGRVEVESEVGIGSTFTLVLPL